MKLKRKKGQRSNGYVNVSSAVARDKELSLRARGLLLTIYSLPDKWEFTVEGLAAVLPEGRKAIYAALRELVALGYCQRVQQNHPDGRFAEITYHFTEEKWEFEPHAPSRYTVKRYTAGRHTAEPHAVSRHTASRYTAKGTQLNKHLINYPSDELNKEGSAREDAAPLPEEDPYARFRPDPPNLKDPLPSIDPVLVLEGHFGAAGRRAAAECADQVRRVVLDTALWTRVLGEWKEAGYNPRNVQGMLERYAKEARRHGERDDHGIIINRMRRLELELVH